ncbi:MAG: hypothetical protein GF329_03725 [Candidatus Lokiarchaeota archaeon]|nr:hypothetical protein [Candidatus Lokiarchaeota archaeon]
MQLDDYFWTSTIIIIDLRRKRGRILFDKTFKNKKRSRRSNKQKDKLNENKKKLDDFISFDCKNKEKKENNSVKLPYRYKVWRVSPEEFMDGKLSEAEIQALRNYLGSDGYLKDLFLLNNLAFWDDLSLNAHQTEVMGRFFIGDYNVFSY